MLQANPERGEVEIDLCGNKYPMRPSYEAVRAIESALGNIVKLFRRINSDGDGLSCDELAIIVTECIRAAGRDRGDEGKMLAAYQRAEIGKLIYQQGLIDVFQQVMPLLGNMLSGGSKKKDNATSPNPSTTES